MISISVGPAQDHITRYLRARLGKEETPDSMNESLEAEILEKIRPNVSEMCVGAMVLKIPPTSWANRYA